MKGKDRRHVTGDRNARVRDEPDERVRLPATSRRGVRVSVVCGKERKHPSHLKTGRLTTEKRISS